MIPRNIKIGDYVYATRWHDGDIDDPYVVGHVSDIARGPVGKKDYVKVDCGWFTHAAKLKSAEYYHVIFGPSRPLKIPTRRVNSICSKLI